MSYPDYGAGTGDGPGSRDWPEPTNGEETPPPARRRPLVMTLAILFSMQLAALAQFAAAGFRMPPLRLDTLWRDIDLGSMPGDWALGAKVPSLIAQGEYWRLVTANFLHGSLFPHLLVNLLGILVFGRLVEMFYGSARLLALFVLSSVGGAIASYLWTPAVSLGASTGIMGLLGVMIAHHTRYRRFLPPRAANALPLLIGIALLQTMLDLFSTQVDIFGHLGGLATGYALGWALEGRIAGKYQAEREWLPLPIAMSTTAALLVYGMAGLALALPREGAMIRAASSRDPLAQLSLIRDIARERPDFVEARQQLIELLALRGEVDEAVSEYKRLLADHPGYQSQEQTKRALELTLVRVYVRSQRDYEAGRNEDALKKTQVLIELATDPEFQAAAYNTHAWILADRLNRDLETAEKYSVRSIAMEPDNSAYIDTLAWIYYRQGRYQKALPLQRRAVKLADLDPFARNARGNGEVYYHLAAILEKLRQFPEAIRYYGKALGHRTAGPQAQAALRRLTNPKPPEIRVPAPLPARPTTPPAERRTSPPPNSTT